MKINPEGKKIFKMRPVILKKMVMKGEAALRVLALNNHDDEAPKTLKRRLKKGDN